MPKKVCVIKGDDTSPEFVLPTVELLEKMGPDIEFTWPLTGEEAIQKYGDDSGFPEEARSAVDEADCTLFGSTSGKTNMALVYLRWGKLTYANLRPIKYMKGIRSPLQNPQGIDFVIVRENLEGLYPGREGDIGQLSPLNLIDRLTGRTLDTSLEGKFAIRIITEKNTRNIAKASCELAMKRMAKDGKGKVTVACKYNMLRQTDGLFRDIVEDTVAQYPDLTFDQIIIDNFAQQQIIHPQQYDVVVMPNEHGDILADGASGLVGGLGLAPSACIGDDYAYFEPVHGTAPDLLGKNIVNPTAMLLSAAMMLEYLSFEDRAADLENAIYAVYAEGKVLTPDMGGGATTTEFCDAVKAKL
jgi:isocitrate/isopropylmalate dehydrogenase